jgi:aspartyl-tRNA(Asn)/glutamyl-tRNA(Gln) amidotransferase subunit A
MQQNLSKSLLELAGLMRGGALSACALAEEALDRHARHGTQLNAYKIWDAARIRQAARTADIALKKDGPAGLLHGLPVSVKDLFGVEGYPTFAGAPRRLPEAWEREGPVIRGLRGQAAVVTGKSHTTEFAFGGTGANIHWGAPRNPWGGAEHRSPGGSSSGAGVSLSEGSAVLALGTDTGGSVRIPASFTGNVGLKLTIGRWSCDGVVPLAPTMDTPGILARSVADAAYGFAALDPANYEANDFMARLAGTAPSGLRLGVSERFMWDDLDPGIGEAGQKALAEAEQKGARIVPFEFPEFEDGYALYLSGSIVMTEFRQFLEDELPAWWETFNPVAKRRVEGAAAASAIEYVRHLRAMARMNKSAETRLAEVDALVLPTSPLSPPRMDVPTTIEDGLRDSRRSSRLTCPVSILGLCALTIPVGLDKAGLPVGLQLVAPGGAEERLLQVGAALERAWGTSRQRLGAPR